MRNQEKTIDQYIAREKELLTQFKFEYKMKASMNEDYPETMLPIDWDEQFYILMKGRNL